MKVKKEIQEAFEAIDQTYVELGFDIQQKHRDCQEMVEILEKFNELSNRLLEHQKRCKKKVAEE